MDPDYDLVGYFETAILIPWTNDDDVVKGESEDEYDDDDWSLDNSKSDSSCGGLRTLRVTQFGSETFLLFVRKFWAGNPVAIFRLAE